MYQFKRLQNLPEFFNGYFINHYNTRNANKFHVNFSRTNYAKHTIVNRESSNIGTVRPLFLRVRMGAVGALINIHTNEGA
jgi:hypothetical protein